MPIIRVAVGDTLKEIGDHENIEVVWQFGKTPGQREGSLYMAGLNREDGE